MKIALAARRRLRHQAPRRPGEDRRRRGRVTGRPGRGAKLPFAIVFLGVLGGVLAFGVIGVFLGPTLLAVGYSLAIEWTSATASQMAANTKDDG